MNEAEEQIRALVDAETAVWNARQADAQAAISLAHEVRRAIKCFERNAVTDVYALDPIHQRLQAPPSDRLGADGIRRRGCPGRSRFSRRGSGHDRRWVR